MENKKIKILVIIVLLSLVGGLSFLFFKKMSDYKKNTLEESQNSINAENEDRQKSYAYVDPNEHVPNKILETKEFVGTITEIFDPANAIDGERLLTVQADVIDIEKIKDVDFSKEKADMPMAKKVFKLKVNSKTQFIKSSLKELQSGDLAFIKTSSGIYSDNNLMAEEITVLNIQE